jgi:hypothetical protein
MTPYSPLPSLLTHCTLIHTVKGGAGGELTREKVGEAMLHKAGRKYHMTTVSPVYKLY